MWLWNPLSAPILLPLPLPFCCLKWQRRGKPIRTGKKLTQRSIKEQTACNCSEICEKISQSTWLEASCSGCDVSHSCVSFHSLHRESISNCNLSTHRSPPASATKTSFACRGISPCQTHRDLPQNANNETPITFYRTDTTQPTKSQTQYHLNLIGIQKTDWGTEDYVGI